MRLLIYAAISAILYGLSYYQVINLAWYYCIAPVVILIIFALLNGFVAVTSKPIGQEQKVKFSDTINLYKRYKNGKL